MKTMVERYETLPEVRSVPDECHDIDSIDSEIAAMEASIAALRGRREELKTRVIEYASQNWSDGEITASGLLEG